jgi:hypothetical protein
MVTYQFLFRVLYCTVFFSNGAEELPSSASFYIHRVKNFKDHGIGDCNCSFNLTITNILNENGIVLKQIGNTQLNIGCHYPIVGESRRNL